MRNGKQRGKRLTGGIGKLVKVLSVLAFVLFAFGCDWTVEEGEPGDTTSVDTSFLSTVDSVSQIPDSFQIYIDSAETVPSDLEDPYWVERQDTLNPDNYIVVYDYIEPDTLKGRILPQGLLYWIDNEVVGCTGTPCPRYGWPETGPDQIATTPLPVPDSLSVLALSVTEELQDSIEVYAAWDTDGEHVVTVCCRTGTSSWSGSPYPQPDTVSGNESTFRITRMTEDVLMTVCVTQTEYGIEICEEVSVPAPEPVSTASIQFASFQQQACEPRLRVWELFTGDRYRIAVEAVGVEFTEELSRAREIAFQEKIANPDSEVMIFDTRPLEVYCDG